MCPHLSVSAMIGQLNGLTTLEMVSHNFFVFDLICQKTGPSTADFYQNSPYFENKKCYFVVQMVLVLVDTDFYIGQ